jgi:hypothetical protein
MSNKSARKLAFELHNALWDVFDKACAFRDSKNIDLHEKSQHAKALDDAILSVQRIGEAIVKKQHDERESDRREKI